MSIPEKNLSLYVGDLPASITESKLFESFAPFGCISVHVVRDNVTRNPLGYGYVNFPTHEDATNALEQPTLKFDGKECRISWSMRDPTFRKTGTNLFISNLPADLDNKSLYEIFSVFGEILSSKIVNDEKNVSRGYGYVHFAKDEDANIAIVKLNGAEIEGSVIKVEKFQSKSERPTPDVWTNLYVKQFPLTYTKEDLEKLFAPYGTVQSVHIEVDETGTSKGHGYVNFENNEDAKKAIAALHEFTVPGEDKKLYVDRHQKKEERKRMLKAKNEADKNELNKKYQNMNLYVKNIADSVSDEEFNATFAVYGQITSSRIMREADAEKTSKGFGFVCYTNVEDATRAIQEMNGKNYHGKLLVVTLYQRKEVRAYNMAAKNAPTKFMGQPMTPPMFSMIPGFAGSKMQPYLFKNYRPAMPYQMQPNVGYPKNFRVQPGQAPMGQYNNAYSKAPKTQPGPNPRYSTPKPVGNAPPAPTPVPLDLSATLLNLTPADQKKTIGNKLYPLVASYNQPLAPKITGMLLEMDNIELLNLIESPDALLSKVNEALGVLANNNLTN